MTRNREPSPDVLRAVQGMQIEQMAAHLRFHRVDLSSHEAVIAALRSAGHGENSVAKLVDRAIEAAK